MMLGFDCALVSYCSGSDDSDNNRRVSCHNYFTKKRGKVRIYSDRNYCNQRFALPSVGGFGNRLPGGNADKKSDDKIIEMFLERVMPKTSDAMLLRLMLQRSAPNCGNALLYAAFFFFILLPF